MKTIALVLFVSLLLSCRHHPEAAGPIRHYPFSGKIVSLDAPHQTATIDGMAIPNYMEAMTMEYPVRSKAEFEALKAGEQITATVDVAADDSYSLSNIKSKSAVR